MSGASFFLPWGAALPATRDELDWCWTESRDQAADYMRYFTEWPKGRHVAAARLRYGQRTWSDTKRAMISEAIKKNAAPKTDPEARKERQARLERFFWTQVTNENSITCIKDYLLRYPTGQFAAQARRQICKLSLQAESEGFPTNSVEP